MHLVKTFTLKAEVVRGKSTRAKKPKPIKITDTDLMLFKLLLDFRLMDTNQIEGFLQRSKRTTQRRLELLYNNAYVDRPERETKFIEGGGGEAIVYSLAQKGREELIRLEPGRYATLSKRVETDLSSRFIQHEVDNTEIALKMFQACLEEDWSFNLRSYHFSEIITKEYERSMYEMIKVRDQHVMRNMDKEEKLTHIRRNLNNAYGWPVKINNKVELLKPDYFPIITNDNSKKRVYLFVEMDRGSMPNVRHNNVRVASDIYTKFLRYRLSAKQQLYKKYFGIIDDFYILFVTTTHKRMENMIEANQTKELGDGWYKFLFTTLDDLKEYGFLDTPWHDGTDKNRTISFRALQL